MVIVRDVGKEDKEYYSKLIGYIENRFISMIQKPFYVPRYVYNFKAKFRKEKWYICYFVFLNRPIVKWEKLPVRFFWIDSYQENSISRY